MLIIAIALTLGSLLALAIGTQSIYFYQWPLVYYCCAIAFFIQCVAFVPALIFRTEKFYDLCGSFTYLTIISFLLLVLFSNTSNVLDNRDLLLCTMVAIWAARLGYFLFTRILQDGGDGRFDEIKKSPMKFLSVWVLQGLWVWVTTACAIAAIASQTSKSLSLIDSVGILVWCVGFAIEVIADQQKRAFRFKYGSEQFINTGLWRYSRHPNYFGEVMLWFGVALIALPVLQSWSYIALISPLFVYILITKISGIPMLETKADKRWGDNTEYQYYKASTSIFILAPPKS